MAGPARLVVGSDGAAPAASILIATRRGPGRLERCLALIASHTADVPHEIILALDAPDDDVRHFVSERVTGAQVVESESNVGVAGAHRLARRQATAPLLVLLHDDTEVTPGWLGRLVATAIETPDAGIFGPLVLLEDGKVRAGGYRLEPDAGVVAVGEGAPPDDPRFAGPYPVDFCAGCCLLVRSSLWDELDGTDESFFPAGYGDVDFALAAQLLGWSVLCEPRAVVVHGLGVGTLPPDFKRWSFARNQRRIVERWGRRLRGGPEREPMPERHDGRASSELELLRSYAWDVGEDLAALRTDIERLEAVVADLVAQRDDALRAGGHEHAVAARALERLAQLERELAGRPGPLRRRRGRSDSPARAAARAGPPPRPSTGR